MRALMRAQLRLAPSACAWCSASWSAGCRCCSRWRPRSAQRRRLLGVPLPWLCSAWLVYPCARRLRLAATSGRPSATSATSPSWSTARPTTGREHRVRARRRCVLVALARPCVDRRVRAAVVPHHLRLLRRLPHGPPLLERVGDRRRVPVGRVVPRRRRAGPRVRRRHALVPGRLRPPATSCCSSRAAPLRRSGAYTLPDFAEARLGSTARAPRRQRARRADRLALPAAAVPGRRAGAADGHRRAGVGRAALLVAVVVAVNVAARRHAQHHLRAGVPVLAEADRARRPAGRSCCWPGGTTARPACRGTAAAVRRAHHRHGRPRRHRRGHRAGPASSWHGVVDGRTVRRSTGRLTAGLHTHRAGHGRHLPRGRGGAARRDRPATTDHELGDAAGRAPAALRSTPPTR